MSQIAEHERDEPELRFPEFEGEWEVERCDYFLKRVSFPVKVDRNKTYTEIGIRSHGRGAFHKTPILGNKLGNKRVFEVVPNALAFNIVFAWEQALTKFSQQDNGLIASHRFPMFLSFNGRSSVDFFCYFFMRPRGKYFLELASPGGAGRNKTLGQNNFAELELTAPSFPEQEKIASFLSAVDEKIAQLEEKKKLLEDYKKGCMQQLFSQALRFKDEDGNDYPEWEEKRLGDALTVGSGRDYKHLKNGDIPVYGTGGFMTSVDEYLYDGESVCIGRKGTIDNPMLLSGKFWTVDTLFYTHKFEQVLPQFIYAIFQRINWKRHNEASGVPSLSKTTIEGIKIPRPHPDEQQKIADFLSVLDDKITHAVTQLEQIKSFKKGLLQKMFV